MYLIKFSPLCVMLWLFSINDANKDNQPLHLPLTIPNMINNVSRYALVNISSPLRMFLLMRPLI